MLRQNIKVGSLIFGLMTFLAVLIGACGDGEGSGQVTGQMSAQTCPEFRCASLDEAAKALEFAVLQPTDLPDGFGLYGRELVAEGRVAPGSLTESPPGATVGPPQPDSSGSESDAQPASIKLDYRFHDSSAVPAILIFETKSAVGEATSLTPSAPGCAEVIDSPYGEFLYMGGVSTIRHSSEDPGVWTVCKSDEEVPRDLHSAYALRGPVLIEVLAFPESGVTKEEFIALVASLDEVQ